ncbi:PetM family of cytochrome b6f complex subunit 7 [filamentous cyanobacterium CCP5]|nr:PetM family of cytochrome b6f complex subunit 7 [filamentous cyanobacterium CCP5]
MASEIFNTGVIAFTIVLIGMGMGFVILRLQGGEE